MIIVEVKGGLGNQMFQYALYRSLLEQGKDVKLNTSHFENVKNNDHIPQHGKKFLLPTIFNIDCRYASPNEVFQFGDVKIDCFSKIKHKLGIYKKSHVFEKQINDKKEIYNLDDVYLDGFWQDFYYADRVEYAIRKEFLFKNGLDSQNRELKKHIESGNSVSLHIRRNDYLNSKIYYQQTVEYYRRAIEFIKEKTKYPIFFCFSDDIEWCKNNLQNDNIIFVNNNSGDKSYVDMQLMASCKHNIITNSSFSVWAAWLNVNADAIVIRPSHYYIDSQRDNSYPWPKNWISI